jgi:outer membrane lipoprotein-sorting protein
LYVVVASLALGGVMAGETLGAQQEQPDPGAILKKTAETYQAMKTLQAELVERDYRSAKPLEDDSAAETQADGELKPTAEKPVTFTFAAPYRLRIESKYEAYPMLVVCNGDTAWVYEPRWNNYWKFPAATYQVGGTHRATLPDYHALYSMIALLFTWNQKAQISREEALEFEGQRVICYVISVKEGTTGGTNTIWVDKDRFWILKQRTESDITLQGAGEPTIGTHLMRFTRIKVDEQVPDDTFIFAPPAGAKEMNSSKSTPEDEAPR